MTPTRPQPVHLDPDPLYVGLPEYGVQVSARGPAIRHDWLFAAVLVVLAILAAALLAAPRTEVNVTSTASPQSGASLAPASPAESEASSWHGTSAGVSSDAPLGGIGAVPSSDVPGASEGTVSGLDAPLPDTATEVVGTASWFCGGGSACTRGVPPGSYAAAAGPALRVGDWRGRIVKVCAGSRCVRVALRDWCQCPRRVIDLYRLPFSKLASPSRGVIRVSVTWGGASAPLPPTSTK